MAAIGVLVADDHPVVREGIRRFLESCSDITVVGDVATREALLAHVHKTRPDVVLLDIRLGDADGIEAARHIRRLYPHVKVMIFTSYADKAYLYRALEVGVHAYVLKNIAFEELTETIRAVHAGERRLSAELIGDLMAYFEQLARAHSQQASGLSEEEIQVLHLMANGATTQQVANTMHWSEATVKRRIRAVLDKLGAKTRAQAVAEAFRRGLIS